MILDGLVTSWNGDPFKVVSETDLEESYKFLQLSHIN